MSGDTAACRARLRCDLDAVQAAFEEALRDAEAVMTPAGVKAWLDGGRRVCSLGWGAEPVLAYLRRMPEVVRATDESVLREAAEAAAHLVRCVCGPALLPFLEVLPGVAQRLGDAQALRRWLELISRVAAEAKTGLLPLLANTPRLLDALTIDGFANWVAFGLRTYRTQAQHYADYFGLQTADSHAAMQRERHGTLLADSERRLKLYLRAFWDLGLPFQPYSLAFDTLRQPMPYLDKLGMHLPDVLHDDGGVPGIDRYRAAIAHMAAHKLWSRPFTADNFSPFQHLAVETFEDARVEALAIRRYPGLRRLWLALHPLPREGACPPGWSGLRHQLAMLSRALLDPQHPYTDPRLLDYVERFRRRMAEDPYDPRLSAELGVAYLLEIHHPDFHSPRIWFEDTVVGYRDDNRWLWRFLEDTDSEDDFHSDHGKAAPEPGELEAASVLAPRHYPEWDYQSRDYRPEWVTVREGIQRPGDPAVIDRLLDGNRLLAKQVERLVDRLKPHRRKRIRHQRDGDELDLDPLVSAIVDARSGAIPDGGIYLRHVPDDRSNAVLVLLDLSESIKRRVEGCDHTLLQLSQGAVTLLGWAVDALGDPLAIAGFSSYGREQVDYIHYKGFAEPWGMLPKARLAAMEAGSATRMGAALRHAGRHLGQRREDKKLLLLISDGQPSDIDVEDEAYLKWDTHQAVHELKEKGIVTFCITLDAGADTYVADIFGRNGYTVVDQVQRLPEKLTRLFMSLTRK